MIIEPGPRGRGWRASLRYLYAQLRNRYRLTFTWFWFHLPFQIVNLSLAIASWFYFATMFGAKAQGLEEYGGDFLAYLLIGMAFNNYLNFSLHTYLSSITHTYYGWYSSRGVTVPLMDYYRLAKVPVSSILLSDLIYGYIGQTINMLLYIIAGVIFFGLRLDQVNYPAAFLLFIIGTLATSAIGVISASMYIFAKTQVVGVEPVSWLLTILSNLVSGVYFPPEILPEQLEALSYYLPQTYILKAVRLAMLQGHSLHMLLPYIKPILIFCIITVPLGVWLIHHAIKHAVKRGTIW